jgi:hypothetical protein
MSIPHWILLACFGAFAGASLFMCARIAVSARAFDPSKPRGSAWAGVAYSFTGAMSPLKKESARRHMPTYLLGLFFHGGVFVAFAWLAALFLGAGAPLLLVRVSALYILAAALSGGALLVKRMIKPDLRRLSCPDDYFSNVFVVGFQIMTAAALVDSRVEGALFVYAAALLLYVPLGKLRHAIYFPLARIYLGEFFGRRGVWGTKRSGQWGV